MCPIFEYLCPSCGLIEVLLMPGEKEPTQCPECKEKGKKNKITKALSAAALSFKGSGFYITDYTNKSGSKSEGSEGSSGESKKSEPKKTEGPVAEKPAPKNEASKTAKKTTAKKKK